MDRGDDDGQQSATSISVKDACRAERISEFPMPQPRRAGETATAMTPCGRWIELLDEPADPTATAEEHTTPIAMVKSRSVWQAGGIEKQL